MSEQCTTSEHLESLSFLQADLYAGALFITKSTGFEGDGPIYLSILLLLAIACVFTVAGGLAAVIWTDFIQVNPGQSLLIDIVVQPPTFQTVLMIIGAIVLAVLGNNSPVGRQFNSIFPSVQLSPTRTLEATRV